MPVSCEDGWLRSNHIKEQTISLRIFKTEDIYNNTLCHPTELSATQSETNELVPETQPLNLTPTEHTGSTHPAVLSTQADPPGSSMPTALKRLASYNKPGLCEQPLNPGRRQEQSY